MEGRSTSVCSGMTVSSHIIDNYYLIPIFFVVTVKIYSAIFKTMLLTKVNTFKYIS